MTLAIKDGTGSTQNLNSVADASGNLAINHSTEGTRNTYSAVSTGLVPAASATDVFVISGSASKTIRVTRISISGTAGTLVTIPVFLARRVSLDTGGTPAANNALPVAMAHDSLDVAASAVLNAYTANPTIVDTSPKLIRAGTVTFGTTAAATVQGPLIWDFTQRNAKGIVLRGAAQQLCINFSSISVSSGVICIDIEWLEDAS